ncbi:MAG: LysR family transcriptional regulator [Eggerthellaceae bacterium]|nr:LysR family transcriptional regulator [Eggerthellaceae bacterium]
MELVHLRAFATVAEYGSLRKAAEALFVAESTVSRHIKTLEEEIRVELFARNHKNLQITPAGKRLLVEAQRVIRSVEGFERVARGMAKNREYAISVGYCGLPYEEDGLISATKALRSQLPGLSVMLEVDRTSGLVEKVRDGRLDVALLYNGSVPDDSSLHAEQLGVARGMIMLPKGHRLAHRGEIALGDLDGESILFEYRGSSPLMHDAVSNAFKEHGVNSFEKVYTQDYRSIPAMVATGQGVALCNSWMENPLPKSITIKELKGDFHTCCILLWREGDDNPMVETFAETLKLYFEQAYPSN